MNLAALTAPLASPAGPCGDDLSLASEFDAIREARRFDDPTLPQGEWVRNIKEADWSGVAQCCADFLTNRAKDLRVAGWWAEARCKADGIGGLADGYELIVALCETYWDLIHPRGDEDDFEERAGALDWLIKQTPRLLREVPLTDSPKGCFSLADQEAARATARKLELHPAEAEAIARDAALTLDDFEAARQDTPRVFFQAGVLEAERLEVAMQALRQRLDVQLGDLAPSFSASFDVLETLHDICRRHAGADPAPAPSQEGAVATAVDRVTDPTTGALPVRFAADGPIRSREQALRQLEEIAAFFRRTEPHSPVAYLAEKAARWGAMSLHEWLRSVVKDDSALLRVEELLGVEVRDDDCAG